MTVAVLGGPALAQRVDLISVPFDGGPLPAVLIDGEPHVVLRPVVEALGLGWKNQHAKLAADEAACMVLVTTQLPGDQQAREVAAVDLETFTLWLAGLQPRRVAEHARPAVASYRRSAGRVLREHFFGKPRSTALSPRELAALVIAEADRADEAEARAALAESAVRELEPAATAWATFQATGATLSVGVAAKYFTRHGVRTGRNRLYITLRDLEWVFKRSCEPTGDAVTAGYVEVEAGKTYRHPKTGETRDAGPRTRLTTHGLERLADHFGVALDRAVLAQYLDMKDEG